MKSKLFTLLTIFSFALLPALLVPQTSYGQKKPVSTEKANKKNKDKKGREEDKKADLKEVEKELSKHHKRLQAKNTRKMMKQSKKKSKRLKANKKEPFFKRLFRKK